MKVNISSKKKIKNFLIETSFQKQKNKQNFVSIWWDTSPQCLLD